MTYHVSSKLEFMTLKRIIVIGCPGSGKSTFSKKLHEITQIPLFHLDNMYWNPDKTTVTRDILIERINQVIEKEEWIIDGNYSSTLQMRFEACDTVFFLDYPVDVCLSGINARQGKERSDIPWIEMEEDEKFMEYIKHFEINGKPLIIDFLNKYSDRHIYHFHHREEAEQFLLHLNYRNEE